MHGTKPAIEINDILTASRRNNLKVSVTGALLFKSILFAQVLEGPLDGFEKILEQIQPDLRQSDLTVLDSRLIETRDFPIWSIAVAGAESEVSDSQIAATLNAAVADPSAAGKQVLTLLPDLVL